MSAKTPIRTVFDGSNNATGLAEFQSGEFIGLTHGGLGASLSIGSAGQVLKVNSGASALEFGNVEAVFNIDGMTDGTSITLADGDVFAISDGGTEKRITASQIKTYVSGTGGTAISALDLDGATDIGAALADADLFIVDDGAGGTNRKMAASRIKTYVADVTLTTAAQTNITSVGTLSSLTVDNIVINGTNIGHTSDTDALAIDSSGNVTASQNLTVTGDLTVNGTTTTVNSTTVTVDDPIFTLGGDSAPSSDDNKDRGIEFRYHTGSAAKVGFFGFDDNTGKFTFIPDATNNSEVFSGTAGTIVATTFEGALSGNATTATALETARTIAGQSFDGSANISIAPTDLTGVTSTAAELNLVDGITAGTVSASKAVIVDSSKDVTGFRNVTLTGELDAATGDFSGDVDVDGTLEADAITVDGTTLSEFISDTVGAMVSSNTESGITVSYDDSDNTLDFTVGTLNQDTTGNAATATALETARTIAGQSFDGSANIAIASTDLSNSSAIALLTSSQTLTNKTLTSPQINTQIDFLARAEARFQDASGGQYVALEAPATVSSNVTFTLPAADGTSGQVVKTDGSGALSFTNVAQAGFSSSTLTTAPGSTGDFDLTKTDNTGSSETPFDTTATDDFGVAIGSVFDLMEPTGNDGTTTDFGALT